MPPEKMLIRVKIHPNMEEFARQFLENRKLEIPLMRACLQEGNFVELGRLAHNLKGNGASYGFPRLTELGAGLEADAIKKVTSDCARQIDFIEYYLVRTVIEVEAETH